MHDVAAPGTEDEPLVLLPGMGCSAALWSGVEGGLARLPGGGPRIVHDPLDADDLEAAVTDLLARLPPRFALAGLSLGGIVAMALVRRAPERVTRLALLSTNARGPSEAQYAAWRDQRDALARGRPARALQEDLLGVLLARPRPELEAWTLAMADGVGATTFDRQLALQATRVDERPALGAVRVPTLVLAGERDALCPVERHEEIRDRVPGARLEVLAGCGHLSPLEEPDAVATALGRWWRTG
jgi:pimeloyl-ACP methyl ester carboxylesterase